MSTVGIQIPDYSSVRMVKVCLVVECFNFRMASGYQTLKLSFRIVMGFVVLFLSHWLKTAKMHQSTISYSKGRDIQ